MKDVLLDTIMFLLEHAHKTGDNHTATRALHLMDEVKAEVARMAATGIAMAAPAVQPVVQAPYSVASVNVSGAPYYAASVRVGGQLVVPDIPPSPPPSAFAGTKAGPTR